MTFNTEVYKYNNEQVWKVFRQNFSWNILKNGLYW